MRSTQDGSEHAIRVLLAKIGLDGHDRGVKVVARTLRDAGMEVIYTGLHRTPEQVIEAAIQEDVDVLGISLLSGAHMPIFTKIFQLLGDLPETPRFSIVAGGVMPDEDEEQLKKMGVAEVLSQDTTPDDIVAKVRWLAQDQPSQL
ncbi:MAG: methylmalonyl-CoA mutase [Actinobacteria bacterium]|nr:methylmalonyl-CoA mutase [Actinomycetota bacterium]